MDGELMFLNFRPPTGSEFTLVVTRNDTIVQIKTLIEDIVRIPIGCQTLSHNGQDLPNDLNLSNTSIINGTAIDLLVQPWTPPFYLVIRPTTGDGITVMLPHRSVTIGQIKEKIRQVTGFPIISQFLLYNDQLLQDHQNLIETPNLDFSIIDLIVDLLIVQLLQNPQPFQPQGYLPQWGLHNPPPVNQLNPSQLQRPVSLHQSQSQLRLPTSSDQEVSSRFRPPQAPAATASGSGNQRVVESMPGHQLNQSQLQRPFYLHQPQPQLRLPTSSDQEVSSRHRPPQAPAATASGSGNQRLVESMSLPTLPSQTINLTLRIPAFVVFDRVLNLTKTVPKSNQQVQFDNSLTIRQIKKMMEEADNVAAERLTLSFNNIELEDNRSLGSYDIRDGSVIEFTVDHSSPALAWASGSGYPGQ